MKPFSPLKYLRERYPNEKWKAFREGMSWGYETENGWMAGWRSAITPRYDGDDETCESRFYVYKPSGPPDRIIDLEIQRELRHNEWLAMTGVEKDRYIGIIPG